MLPLSRTHTLDTRLQRKPRCVHYASTEHTSTTEHADNECKECEKDTKYPYNNLKCVNYNGNYAANDRAARCG